MNKENIIFGIIKHTPKRILYWFVVQAWAKYTTQSEKGRKTHAPDVTCDEVMRWLDK